MKILVLASAAILIASPAFAGEASGKDVFGVWQVQSGNAHVEIKDCSDSTPCGSIVHINAPNPMSILDDANPEPEMAKKPLIGAPMLWGFKEKKSKWSGGRIYDAESGKSYKSKLERQEDGTLKVKGCVGPICQSQIWTRVEPQPSAVQ